LYNRQHDEGGNYMAETEFLAWNRHFNKKKWRGWNCFMDPNLLERQIKYLQNKTDIVFRLLTDFVCLYNYEFWLSLCNN
jgi:hypothetical protein